MTTNLDNWNFIVRSTPPCNYYEAVDLFCVYRSKQRNSRSQVTNALGVFIPIPIFKYVVVCVTKFNTITGGTYTLTLNSTTDNDIILYSSIDKTQSQTISGTANSNRVCTVSLSANTEYVFVLVQSNTDTNRALFVKTDYTGIRIPQNSPFKGCRNCDSDEEDDCIKYRSYALSTVLVGDIRLSARTCDFDGWLLCNGRAVYRNAYPALFAIIGTSFGTGDGSTTFNIPDFRGRVFGAVGQGSALTNRLLGSSLGEERHKLIIPEMPLHTHTGTTDSVDNHSHVYNDAYFAENISGPAPTVFGTNSDTDGDNSFFYRKADGGNSTTPQDLNTSSAGGHSHTFTTGSTGEDNYHNNMQPTLFAGSVFICVEVSCGERMR